MEKKANNKIINCLYVIVVILIVNTIILLVIASKISEKEMINNTSTNSNTNTTEEYDTSMFETLTAAQVTEKIKSGSQFVLYIGREGCTYCRRILPSLQKAQTNYKYTTVYLDIDKSAPSSDEYKEMAKLLNVKKTVSNETKEFGEFQYTPMIAVIDKGKMVDGMIGYNTYENLASFLEKAGIKK